MQTIPALRVADDLPPDVQLTENLRSGPAWGPVKKLLFRFAFVYLILYSFPFPLYYIPYVGTAAMGYYQIWKALVPWVGKHVFNVIATAHGANGSGDSTYGYVQIFCYLVISISAALMRVGR